MLCEELEGPNGPSKWREQPGAGAKGRGYGESCCASAINLEDVGAKGGRKKKLVATYHRQASIHHMVPLRKGCSKGYLIHLKVVPNA